MGGNKSKYSKKNSAYSSRNEQRYPSGILDRELFTEQKNFDSEYYEMADLKQSKRQTSLPEMSVLEQLYESQTSLPAFAELHASSQTLTSSPVLLDSNKKPQSQISPSELPDSSKKLSEPSDLRKTLPTGREKSEQQQQVLMTDTQGNFERHESQVSDKEEDFERRYIQLSDAQDKLRETQLQIADNQEILKRQYSQISGTQEKLEDTQRQLTDVHQMVVQQLKITGSQGQEKEKKDKSKIDYCGDKDTKLDIRDEIRYHIQKYLQAETAIFKMELRLLGFVCTELPQINVKSFCGLPNSDKKKQYICKYLESQKKLMHIRQTLSGYDVMEVGKIDAEDFSFLKPEMLEKYELDYKQIRIKSLQYIQSPNKQYENSAKYAKNLRDLTELQLKLAGFIHPKVEITTRHNPGQTKILPGGSKRKIDCLKILFELMKRRLQLSGFVQPTVQNQPSLNVDSEYLGSDEKMLYETETKFFDALRSKIRHQRHLVLSMQLDEELRRGGNSAEKQLDTEWRSFSRDVKKTKSGTSSSFPIRESSVKKEDQVNEYNKRKLASIEIESVAIRNRKATSEEISAMAFKLLDSSSNKFQVEFRACGLTSNQLKRLRNQLKDAQLEISTLVFSYMENIQNLLDEIFLFVEKYRTKCLSFEYDELNDGSIKAIKNHLEDGKNWTSLESLDISYNKDISPVGFKQIGEIVRKSDIASLKATGCCITNEKLENFFAGLQDGRLKALNIGRNAKLTSEGARALAEFVVDKGGIQSLNLSGCKLSQKTIDVFCNILPKAAPEPLLGELDASYNSTIGLRDESYNSTISPYASLGLVVVNYGITKLSLAGCKLNGEHLSSFQKVTSDHKMNTINMRDNFSIGEGIIEIANLVSQCQLKELNLADCWLSSRELKYFAGKLNGTKLNRLRLGDREREPDACYITEICNLLTSVDELYLQFRKLSNIFRLRLKEKCSGSSSKVILSVGSDEECILNETEN